MIKTFTQDELIKYVYDELSEGSRDLIERALINDQELAEECSELLSTKIIMESTLRTPSEKSILSILNYSKNLSLQS